MLYAILTTDKRRGIKLVNAPGVKDRILTIRRQKIIDLSEKEKGVLTKALTKINKILKIGKELERSGKGKKRRLSTDVSELEYTMPVWYTMYRLFHRRGRNPVEHN